jgi:hypothetical protein
LKLSGASLQNAQKWGFLASLIFIPVPTTNSIIFSGYFIFRSLKYFKRSVYAKNSRLTWRW